MILNLVDRQQDPGGVPALLTGAGWELLARLAAGIGQPAWPVDVVLVTDPRMAELNREYRGKDGVTDVLSFSYLETAGGGEPDLGAGQHGAPADLWLPTEAVAVESAVGELVLAPDFIADRCAAEGWSLRHELALLVVHGCLHLLGWDHAESAEQAAMQRQEETILAAEGLDHPLLKRS